MYEVIFDRNGAKAHVKNLRVLSQRKSAKRGFMRSYSHSKIEIVNIQNIGTL